MNNEIYPQSENFLAQDDKSDKFDDEQVKLINSPIESIDRGLVNLYEKYLREINQQLLKGQIDQEKADELTKNVLTLSEKDGVNNELKYMPIERAQAIMGEGKFFGPWSVKAALGIELDGRIPLIPFDAKELARAKELQQALILRVDKANNGQPLTMQKLEELALPLYRIKGGSKVINEYPSFKFKTEEYYTTGTPNLEWALTTQEIIFHSRGRNYLDQTQILINYLKDQVFSGLPLPQRYGQAIEEFGKNYTDIQGLMFSDNDWDKIQAVKKLSNLAINQLTRHSLVEALYDNLINVIYQDIDTINPNSTWTNTSLQGNQLSSISFISPQIDILWAPPHIKNGRLGTAFTRRL